MGSKPFDHLQDKKLEEMIMEHDFPKISERISKRLRDLIIYMLGKDFTLRPTMDQVLGCKIILD